MSDVQDNISSISSTEDTSNLQFPWKLHLLLNESEGNENHEIISWMPNGVCFKVHNKEKFASEIMPKYFQSNKHKSFQRSLNLWGFQTETKSPGRGAIYHPCFVRGKPERCHLMKRVKVKVKKGSEFSSAVAIHGQHDAQLSLAALAARNASPTNSSFQGMNTVHHSPSNATQEALQHLLSPALPLSLQLLQNERLSQQSSALLGLLSSLGSATPPKLVLQQRATPSQDLTITTAGELLRQQALLQSLSSASIEDSIKQQTEQLRTRILANLLVGATGTG